MSKLMLNREQQQFLVEIFETKDVLFAAERFQIMLSEGGLNPSDMIAHLNRIMARYRAKTEKK